MATREGTEDQIDAGAAAREIWRLGDYARVATDVVAPLGRDLVDACRITAGQRVLDVAAGAGNAAIPAAEEGADVIALDITPELFDAGRSEAARRGVHVEWIEGDAQNLPFGDDEFDVVISSIGAMFAPDHQRTADELLRVCRRGGTIGMINWPPEGMVAGFFKLFAAYAPPPPVDFQPPTLWGDEAYVAGLFGSRVEGLDVTKKKLIVDHFESPEDECAYYKRHFGPTIATYASIAADPEKVRALDRDFLEYARRTNVAPEGERPVYELEYVRMVLKKSSRDSTRV